MRILTAAMIVMLGLSAAFHAPAVHGEEPATATAEGDSVAKEMASLGTEYEAAVRKQRLDQAGDGGAVSDSTLSDEEWLRLDLEAAADPTDPDNVLLPQLLALAKANPKSPFALDALFFVMMRGGYHSGNVRGENWRIKEQAIELVEQQHLADPRVALVFKLLSGSIPSQKSEAFLRRAWQTGSDRATRGAAGFYLARYLHMAGKVHASSEHIKRQEQVANNERFWKLVVAPYLDKECPYDPTAASAEIERLLTTVKTEYADVPALDWKWSGPAKMFLRGEPYSPPKTFGDLARALWYEHDRLAPGHEAPEIEGRDAEGNRFRLSDYRGKVVLLTFSANWCGGCVELYPLQRKLLEKFHDRPFVVLSVSCDETVDTLKSSIAEGEIAWRCWWDGLHGPICEAWNVHGAPTLFLLDRQGMIQDVRLTRVTPPAEFERAITPLLGPAETDK